MLEKKNFITHDRRGETAIRTLDQLVKNSFGMQNAGIAQLVQSG
jgi:hypothetical protein